MKAEGLKPQHGPDVWIYQSDGDGSMKVSQLVRDLEQQLQHQHGEEGVGPVVGAGSWGGGNRHLGRDTWLWGAEQGWLGHEALRGEGVGCGLQVVLGCLTTLLHKTMLRTSDADGLWVPHLHHLLVHNMQQV